MLGKLWCKWFHKKISLPVNGMYRCWVCLREWPAWKEGKETI